MGLSLQFFPLLPTALLVALAAAGLALICLGLFYRARGTLLRALALSALLLTLANPMAIQETRDSLSDIVFLVIDESPSQSIDPRPDQTREATAHLRKELAALPGVEIRELRIGGDAADRERGGTRLFAPLMQALARVPRDRIGGVFLVSDGRIHDLPLEFSEIGIAAPFHLALTGRNDEADRRLRVESAPTFGIVGKTVTVALTVEDLGLPQSARRITVTLERAGKPPREYNLSAGEREEIKLDITHRGANVFQFEVEPGPRELTLANNRVALVVNGVRDRLRVLLVSGEPHTGERVWRNILKSDPSVDLVHFTILRPPEKQDGTPIKELALIAFPTRELFEVKLSEFDLIVFDRYRRRGVLPNIYLNNVASYIKNGGALLEAAGPSFATSLSLYRTPLGQVLPAEPNGDVIEQGFAPALTDLGERHPVTARLPATPVAADMREFSVPGGDPAKPAAWGRWFRHIAAEPKSGNVVMLGAQNYPLLILDRVGKGRVAQLMSDHIWLWARGFEGGGPHAELIRRLAHWLMKEPDLEEEDLRAEIDRGELLVERRSLGPLDGEVEVTYPSGRKESLTLTVSEDGAFAQGRAPADEVGLYRVSDGERHAITASGALNPLEYEDLRSDSSILAPLVKDSGGGILRLAEDGLPALRKVAKSRSPAGRNWLGVVAQEAHIVTGIVQTALLPPLLLLLAALGGMLAAWHRESR
jgi:hypothetical protein